jgi:uncharacterized membrane protein
MSIERPSAEPERTLVLVAYVLHLIGAVAGVTSLIGLIVNYVKRNGYDDCFATHHAWMIRSFWWAILWCVVGLVTTIVLIGWAILLVVWVWYVYRHVRGLIALLNGQPMPL